MCSCSAQTQGSNVTVPWLTLPPPSGFAAPFPTPAGCSTPHHTSSLARLCTPPAAPLAPQKPPTEHSTDLQRHFLIVPPCAPGRNRAGIYRLGQCRCPSKRITRPSAREQALGLSPAPQLQ